MRWVQEGLTQVEVPNRLNVAQSVVRRAWYRFVTTGSPANRHGGTNRELTAEGTSRLTFAHIEVSPNDFLQSKPIQLLRHGMSGISFK